MPPAPPQTPGLGTPAWGNRTVWSNTVRTVAYARLAQFEKARDKEVFCPGYAQANIQQRLNCWVMLVAAISKFESAFAPADSFREPDGNYSVGLLALSPRECPNAHSIEALKNPIENLICGTNKMARLIDRDGFIDGPPQARGAARYWSTLRAPYQRWDPSRKRSLNLGKKQQILPLVRGYKGVANHMPVAEFLYQSDAYEDLEFNPEERDWMDRDGFGEWDDPYFFDPR